MADSTPPPGQEERRSDGATRAIVLRLEALEKESAAMRALLTGYVTFRGALLGMVAALGLAGTFGAFFLSRAEAAAKDAGAEATTEAREAKQDAREAKAEAKEATTFVRVELQDFKRELKADMADLKSEVRNAAVSVRRDVKRAAVAQDGGP